MSPIDGADPEMAMSRPSNDNEPPPDAEQLVATYHRLRIELNRLYAEPVPDYPAIDRILIRLDDTHAALKARARADGDTQRY